MTQAEVQKLKIGDQVRVLFDFDGLKPDEIHLGTVVCLNDYTDYTISYDYIFDTEYYPFWNYDDVHLYCWNTHFKRILGLAKTPKGNEYVPNR